MAKNQPWLSHGSNVSTQSCIGDDLADQVALHEDVPKGVERGCTTPEATLVVELRDVSVSVSDVDLDPMDNSVAVPYEQSVLEMQEGLVQKCDAVVVDSQCSRPMLLPPLQLGLCREVREVADERQAIPVPRVCILIHEARVA